MAGSKTEILLLRRSIAILLARIRELELKLKHYSAHYGEGGSGEYVNNEEAMNRFEGKT